MPAYWRHLGLPGLIDAHVHFLPERVQAKVWAFFDAAESHYGSAWPVHYRLAEDQRVARLRALGVLAFPSLPYPHKPEVARWLNEWSAEFARRTPECVHSATLFPEPGVEEYVRAALDGGARWFKVHVQVGRFDPDDAVLDSVWGLLAEAGVPVTIHSGSRPVPGEYTGPGPVERVLARHPRLALVIAHMGMHEYAAHLDLAVRFARVHLDTTMFATDFTERFAPLPDGLAPRLADLADRIVLGSDFPSIPYPYAHQLEALHRLGLGADWLRGVLHDNAARLLDRPTAGAPR
ncbi:amidohydrolase family protein [soil metagenome]